MLSLSMFCRFPSFIMEEFSDASIPYLNFSFPFISISISDFMHPIKEHAFWLVISFMNVCYSYVALSIQVPLSHPFFVCLHLFQMFVINILYSVPFFDIVCSFRFIILRISFVISFFFSFLWMILFTNVTRASLQVFHLEFQISSKLLYFLLTLSTYIC